MKKLIPLSDFVLEQRMTSEEVNDASFQQIQDHICTYYDKVFAYTNFLKQPLTLGMFVPVDEDGNVWNEPVWQVEYEKRKVSSDKLNSISEKYKKAKEKVLFEGFKISNSHIEASKHTIFLESTNGEWIGHKHNWEENWDLYGITVEGMLSITENEIELTPSALEAIGIKE